MRPKLNRASRARKTATAVIETLGIASLAAEGLASESLAASPAAGNRDKDILQRGNLFLLCTDGNLGCQVTSGQGGYCLADMGAGVVRRLRESSRRLQTIALAGYVSNVTGLA